MGIYISDTKKREHISKGTFSWRKKCAAVVQIEKTACADDGLMRSVENKLLLRHSVPLKVNREDR